MKIINYFTSFQEVPNYLSLCFSVYGCRLNCENCSWKSETKFVEYSIDQIYQIIDKYSSYVSAVCMLGGEWDNDIVNVLAYAKKANLKTCLYTGLPAINDQNILHNLDFLKTGPYIESLGGLASKTTNQVFIDVATRQVLNNLFQR